MQYDRLINFVEFGHVTHVWWCTILKRSLHFAFHVRNTRVIHFLYFFPQWPHEWRARASLWWRTYLCRIFFNRYVVSISMSFSQTQRRTLIVFTLQNVIRDSAILLTFVDAISFTSYLVPWSMLHDVAECWFCATVFSYKNWTKYWIVYWTPKPSLPHNPSRPVTISRLTSTQTVYSADLWKLSALQCIIIENEIRLSSLSLYFF